MTALPETVRFDPDQLAELARLIAAELRNAPAELVDAATLAALLGVSRDYVYENSAKLGAVKIGDGERPRLRFNVETARAAMTAERQRPEKVRIGRRRVRPVSSLPNANGPASRERPGPGQRS